MSLNANAFSDTPFRRRAPSPKPRRPHNDVTLLHPMPRTLPSSRSWTRPSSPLTKTPVQ
ncbi:hypothetical protein M404DRAFT_1004252 [Pisolithus tinctorius Marx 270]|uniref:Uncharacterized protein n=1 Tax=Pisolithus tinctorius Marx 270 TaxID=870435 RepID=A0A0C3ISR3_PISTI|nr:hypothetical protein M404DRAFT_1004252 [Pisolithus tinctorius Marx 270]